ncbi:MAG TPA: GntR family transcriptional regulator [Anaerolineae bacterium]|nr:GntR family transcriptional regulator [Anaerolineae bacterium]
MKTTTIQSTLELIRFDRNLPIPFYQQLKVGLTDAIREQRLPGGVRLPSEREFCEYFGISRLTVRRALNDLTSTGWLVSQPGKGTFVRQPKVVQGTQQLMGLSSDMKRRGHTVTSKILKLALMPAPRKTAERMNISPEEKVVLLERLRRLDGEPLAIERCYLKHQLCPGITRYDLTKSLYTILRQTYGLKIIRADQTYEAVAASLREAQLLGIARRAPMLRSERTTYLENDEVIEHGFACYRGDRYKFHTVLLESASPVSEPFETISRNEEE